MISSYIININDFLVLIFEESFQIILCGHTPLQGHHNINQEESQVGTNNPMKPFEWHHVFIIFVAVKLMLGLKTILQQTQDIPIISIARFQMLMNLTLKWLYFKLKIHVKFEYCYEISIYDGKKQKLNGILIELLT